MEFGFPGDAAQHSSCRPENRAVADFLRAWGPFTYHASLHGMAIAEGAWYLLDKEHVDASVELRGEMASLTKTIGLPLHDWDRGGEKGFHRIEPGFCTTPTSTAMKEHFLGLKQTATAEKFLLSSMEYVTALGGTPLCMVSEIPLFLVKHSPARSKVPGKNFLEAKERLLSADMQRATGNPKPLEELKSRFGFKPVERSRVVKLQLGMIFLGAELAPFDDLDL